MCFSKPGNHGCASVDIKVGKSTWHEGRPYEILLPNTTLMSPAECKDWVHISRVFMFGQSELRSFSIIFVIYVRDMYLFVFMHSAVTYLLLLF